MTLRRICEINDEHELVISLPDNFRHLKRVLVTVDDLVDGTGGKMELLKQAAEDPLFLADIREARDDFSHADDETL